MAEYMLDTDISSYIMKRSHDSVLRRLRQVPIGVVCISVITKSELLFGVEVSPRRQQDHAALNEYLRHVEVLDFPDEAARHYAQICAALKARGAMIGANDLFIAAHARSLELTLVTKQYRRVRSRPRSQDRKLDCVGRLRADATSATFGRPASRLTDSGAVINSS